LTALFYWCGDVCFCGLCSLSVWCGGFTLIILVITLSAGIIETLRGVVDIGCHDLTPE
jgi:hypothetical protein